MAIRQAMTFLSVAGSRLKKGPATETLRLISLLVQLSI